MIAGGKSPEGAEFRKRWRECWDWQDTASFAVSVHSQCPFIRSVHSFAVSVHSRCLFIRGVCSFAVSVHSRCLFVRGVCSFAVSVRSRCLFVRSVCSLAVSVRSRCLFVRGVCSFAVSVRWQCLFVGSVGSFAVSVRSQCRFVRSVRSFTVSVHGEVLVLVPREGSATGGGTRSVQGGVVLPTRMRVLRVPCLMPRPSRRSCAGDTLPRARFCGFGPIAAMGPGPAAFARRLE
jgi:hypothetical protein